MKHFSENQIIQADFIPGPARVKKFERRRAFYLLEVMLQDTGEYRALRLTEDQLAQIELVQQSQAARGDPEDFFLFIEAHRIRLAYQFDPMLAVSVSQVDPLPHQIEAVYHHALEMPRLRFLIADDPGAGKTVMAGLIVKEMQYRGLVQRILIVAPGHLKYQWQREMKEKFGTAFRLVDRSAIRSHWGENVWDEVPLAITSIDFLKQDDVKVTLAGTQWDLVIVDEAHKMSAYAYETQERTKIDKTKRYQVGEVLSRQAEHLLFLTATPHRGDEENFRLFLDLLRPGFFAKRELLRESVERGENPLFIRRLKEDMKRFDGTPIFPPRTVKTVSFRMTEDEIKLYNAVTQYVQNYFDQARENRNVTFALVILQRRLTSSVYAILSSLQRRRERMKELLGLPEKIREDERYAQVRRMSPAEIEDLPEDERWAVEEMLEHLTIARNIDDVQAEIEQLDGLIVQAKRVREQETESKLLKLRDEILAPLDDHKLLIFTEHKDTLWYLEERLRAWGYAVNVIHGGMDLDARVEAERVFRDETQILVATEAAGEGINLQFCSLMVNYDIPWNPNRLEQRMGRIHRYGQDREVFIWNLIAKETREGQILERIFDKLERMREALGTDRVFDIIGDVIPGTNLGDLLKDAIFNQRRMEEIEWQIDQVDETHTAATLERVFLSSLASRHIDYTGLMKERLEAQENRLVPEYVQDFFQRGFSHLGGTVAEVENGFRIESVPLDLRNLNHDVAFKTRFGTVQRAYRRVTFAKQTARGDSSFEFVAPGHPLLEALNEVILHSNGHAGIHMAVFTDPAADRRGVLWFVEGVVRDGTGAVAGRRVFCVIQVVDGAMQTLNPAVLWDLQPLPEAVVPEAIQLQVDDRDAIEDYLVGDVLFPYRAEIEARRQHDAEVKERYGIRSLDYLIQESNQKLLEYEVRAAGGETMDIVIRNEQRNLERLEERKQVLTREIGLERNVTVDEPKILGVVALVAAPNAVTYPMPDDTAAWKEDAGNYEADPERKKEIELVGMRVATAYEETHGWQVTDVSHEDHGGFDLRSLCFDEDGVLVGVRYIEVKARARTGAIRISSNEWKKARRYGEDYWLYVVTNAGTDSPILQRIQNPAGCFEEGESIFATGFVIPEDRWREEADRESLMDLHEAFIKQHGPSPLRAEDFEGLRSTEEGRTAPFGETDPDEADH